MNKKGANKELTYGERRTKLFKTVSNANTALIESYFNSPEKAFVDRDQTHGKGGILSNAVGLTSIMLTLCAFYKKDDGEVISSGIIDKYTNIVNKLISDFYDAVKSEGYAFAPILLSRNTNWIFNAEERIGSTDTATWILSSSILARYAIRRGIVSVDGDILDKTKFLIYDSLKILLESQRPDGTWGFATWKTDSDIGQAKKSLYFSYSVATSLADFFYYIGGDIGNIDSIEDARDEEMIRYLSGEFGCDVIEKAKEARRRLQDWIITDCLPLLPRLSSCNELKPEERDALGLFSESGDKEDQYFNLYYTFYLIDMIISSEVDIRYDELELAEYIDDVYGSGNDNGSAAARILKSYQANGFIADNDRSYYLGLDPSTGRYEKNDQHIDQFLSDYLQQAVHNSRSLYIESKRTSTFWKTSELRVEWKHDDSRTNNMIVSQVKYNSSYTDPAFVPMALRANADYVFYISKMPDSFLNELFSEICDDVFDENDEQKYEECIPYLWDSEKYSLFVTERSIESLVDYFDYLNRIETKDEKPSETVSESALDKAVNAHIESFFSAGMKSLNGKIEEMIKQNVEERVATEIAKISFKSSIKEFLNSPEGKELIKDSPSPVQSYSNGSEQDFAKIISGLQRHEWNSELQNELEDNIYATVVHILNARLSDLIKRVLDDPTSKASRDVIGFEELDKYKNADNDAEKKKFIQKVATRIMNQFYDFIVLNASFKTPGTQAFITTYYKGWLKENKQI